MTRHIIVTKKKKDSEENLGKWNKKCLTCVNTCKQFSFSTIVRCPLYRRKDEN